MIELELNPAKLTENDSPVRNGRNKRGHKRNRGDDCNEDPVSKRQRLHGESNTLPRSKTYPSSTRDTSSAQQPIQTRSSHANSDTLPLDLRSLRAVRAPRASSKKSDSEKSGAALDSVGVKNGRWCRKFSLGTPDSRVLCRSSRLRRPPERFQ